MDSITVITLFQVSWKTTSDFILKNLFKLISCFAFPCPFYSPFNHDIVSFNYFQKISYLLRTMKLNFLVLKIGMISFGNLVRYVSNLLEMLISHFYVLNIYDFYVHNMIICRSLIKNKMGFQNEIAMLLLRSKLFLGSRIF